MQVPVLTLAATQQDCKAVKHCGKASVISESMLLV